MPGCQTAALSDCQIARLLDCQIARLPDCWIARLLDCQIAGLLDCQIADRIARLLDCRIAGLPDCWIAALQDCQIAGLPGCWIARSPDCCIAGLPDCRIADIVQEHSRLPTAPWKRIEKIKCCLESHAGVISSRHFSFFSFLIKKSYFPFFIISKLGLAAFCNRFQFIGIFKAILDCI